MNMKLHINKITMSILAGAALLFSACSDGDTVFDDIVANENRGGVLRTVEILSDEIPIGQTDSSFGVTLEGYGSRQRSNPYRGHR
jgi:hypothetical protein